MQYFTKFFTVICLSLLLCSLTHPAAAEEADASAIPKAAIVIRNHAHVGHYKGQDLDAALAAQVQTAIQDTLSGAYQITEPYETDYWLKKAGIADPAAAEQSALTAALTPLGADCIILADIQPFQHKNHQSLFKFTVETTATMYVSALDTINRTTLMEKEYKATAEKKDPFSYNEVIPLAMEQIIKSLQTDLREKLAIMPKEAAYITANQGNTTP